MKIEYVEGDLFTTNIPLIVHGCNAQGVMGSGVAKIIRERFPRAYEKYREAYTKGTLELGSIIAVPCYDVKNSNVPVAIVNAITQEFYGRDGKRYVSYDAVAESMSKINRMAEEYEFKAVAMPRIGAGLGGGNWNVIEAIIESELKSVKPFVYALKGE